MGKAHHLDEFIIHGLVEAGQVNLGQVNETRLGKEVLDPLLLTVVAVGEGPRIVDEKTTQPVQVELVQSYREKR